MGEDRIGCCRIIIRKPILYLKVTIILTKDNDKCEHNINYSNVKSYNVDFMKHNLLQLVKNTNFLWLSSFNSQRGKKNTRSARIRALSGVPTPTAISFTPADSNLSLDSFRAEASSQL